MALQFENLESRLLLSSMVTPAVGPMPPASVSPAPPASPQSTGSGAPTINDTAVAFNTAGNSVLPGNSNGNVSGVPSNAANNNVTPPSGSGTATMLNTFGTIASLAQSIPANANVTPLDISSAGWVQQSLTQPLQMLAPSLRDTFTRFPRQESGGGLDLADAPPVRPRPVPVIMVGPLAIASISPITATGAEPFARPEAPAQSVDMEARQRSSALPAPRAGPVSFDEAALITLPNMRAACSDEAAAMALLALLSVPPTATASNGFGEFTIAQRGRRG
jgi:hypothetical protein